MIAGAYEVLEAARVQAEMSFEDLWLAYFALGGSSLPVSLRAYLAGDDAEPDDYNVVVVALNERFHDRGQNNPVPYRDA